MLAVVGEDGIGDVGDSKMRLAIKVLMKKWNSVSDTSVAMQVWIRIKCHLINRYMYIGEIKD